MRAFACAALAALLVAAAARAAVGQSNAPPGDAVHGKAVFVTVGCYECHGVQGQGSGRRGNGSSTVGPMLAPKPIPWAAFIAQVRKPRAIMPSFDAASLSDKDAADVYAYLASIPPARSPGEIPLLKGYVGSTAASR